MTRDELQERRVYRLRSRNLTLGVWNGNDRFIGLREKWGHTLLDSEIFEHTAWPLEPTEHVLPDPIPLEEYLGSYDGETGRPVAFSDELKAETGWGWHFLDGDRENDRAIKSYARSNKELYEFLLNLEGEDG